MVNGACSRLAAIEYVAKHRKSAETMKAKFDKTPARDRDRKGAFERWGGGTSWNSFDPIINEFERAPQPPRGFQIL